MPLCSSHSSLRSRSPSSRRTAPHIPFPEKLIHVRRVITFGDPDRHTNIVLRAGKTASRTRVVATPTTARRYGTRVIRGAIRGGSAQLCGAAVNRTGTADAGAGPGPPTGVGLGGGVATAGQLSILRAHDDLPAPRVPVIADTGRY